MPSNVDKHSVEGEKPVRLCNYVDVYKNDRVTGDLDYMLATASDSQIERFTLRAEDVVVTKDSEEPTDIGVPAYVPADMPGVVCGYHLAVLRPDLSKLHGGYLAWWLRSSEAHAYFSTAATGISRYALSVNDIGMTPVLRPPLSEQQRIANFLDQQTARIDALIAEKERLLDLLSEHRLSICEAVIADAVNRSRAKLGHFVDLLPGFAFPSDEFSSDPDDIPLLRGVNVAPGAIRWGDVVYWSKAYAPALERFRLQTGDVVFGMDRPWIAAGARVAQVGPEESGTFLLQRVCRLRGGEKLRQRFIYYALASDMFRQSVEAELTGVSVPHISPEQILRFRVPVLSPAEQDSRCAVADEEDRRIRILEAHAAEHIDRLREYRSSLISAAVTGQLDISTFRAKLLEAA